MGIGKQFDTIDFKIIKFFFSKFSIIDKMLYLCSGS